jgi:hypothetical protein
MVDPHTGNNLEIMLSLSRELTANMAVEFPSATAQSAQNPPFAPFLARLLPLVNVSSVKVVASPFSPLS